MIPLPRVPPPLLTAPLPLHTTTPLEAPRATPPPNLSIQWSCLLQVDKGGDDAVNHRSDRIFSKAPRVMSLSVTGCMGADDTVRKSHIIIIRQ